MKIDPYNHERRYRNWKESVKEGNYDLNKENFDIIFKYIEDMEHGLNVSMKSVKGGRGYARLNTLKEKMYFFARQFKEMYNLDCITQISEEQIILFFSKMRRGEIKRRDGRSYRSIDYFTKVFKAFWHWHQTVNRKKGIAVVDITIDLDTRGEKPKWVYLTEEQIKQLCENASPKYKALFLFLYDSGIRSPTELINIKVSDLYNGCKELMIRDEISKTFGRRIKLMICCELIEAYIKYNNLSPKDYLFKIKPSTVNVYLKRLSKRLFGDKESPAGQKYSEMTMYDFRHCSCCYWLPRYKSESALKYRFGWKKSDKIHYYSELLGMKDTISEEDLLLDTTKTELEQRLEKTERENQILKERLKIIELKINNITLRI